MVEIQPGGEKEPLFLVHPIGGNVFCYADLARLLGTDGPCFGLQSPAPGEGARPLERVEDMAALYCERMRAVQPSRPYLLGGWSMGALIALEMAQRLRADGGEVGLLALLDPPPPPSGAAPATSLATLARWFVEDLAGLNGQSALQPAEVRELEASADPLQWALRRARAAGSLPPDLEPGEMARHFEVFRRNQRALHGYRARPYDGPAVLLLAAEAPDAAARNAAWTSLIRRVEVVRVPGDHYSLLRAPQLAPLAAELAARLERRGWRRQV
jgi:thioesterase domain-containing protein